MIRHIHKKDIDSVVSQMTKVIDSGRQVIVLADKDAIRFGQFNELLTTIRSRFNCTEDTIEHRTKDINDFEVLLSEHVKIEGRVFPNLGMLVDGTHRQVPEHTRINTAGRLARVKEPAVYLSVISPASCANAVDYINEGLKEQKFTANKEGSKGVVVRTIKDDEPFELPSDLSLEMIMSDQAIIDRLSFVDLVSLNINAIWNGQNVDMERILTKASLKAIKDELKVADHMVSCLINDIDMSHENYGVARRFNGMINYIITGAHMRLLPEGYPNPYEDGHAMYERKKIIADVFIPAVVKVDMDLLKEAGQVIVDSFMEARDSTINCIVDIAVDYYDKYSSDPTNAIIVNKCIQALTDLKVGRNAEIHRLVEDKYYAK